jgi:sialate O-acetylesterase
MSANSGKAELGEFISKDLFLLIPSDDYQLIQKEYTRMPDIEHICDSGVASLTDVYKSILMKTSFLYLTLPVLMAFSSPAFSKITLPAFFSDGMVLQQKSRTKIWGFSTERNQVSLETSWDHRIYHAKTGADGRWAIQIHTPVAGGPFTLRIGDNEQLMLKDVLVGEVWLASGQSNMEMPLKGYPAQPVNNAEAAILEQANSSIRFFAVKNNASRKVVNNCEGNWKEASAANRPDFSAVAYFFAKAIQEKLHVPVGILEADWGGTLIEAWMSEQSVRSVNADQQFVRTDTGTVNKNEPAVLYNAMIHPLIGYGMKGVIWYQGEQNRQDPAGYAKFFPAMVRQWRKDWGAGNFPFIYAQIAPFYAKGTPNAADKAVKPFVPFLREAQLNALSKIPNSGMAVLTDAGASNTIHPPEKQIVAGRLALIAFGRAYGMKDVKWQSPQYHSMKVTHNRVTLNFKHTGGAIELKPDTTATFEVAGKDRVFHHAKARVEAEHIIVSSKDVEMPIAVRYAFKAWTTGIIYNHFGFPCSSFRTDHWPMPGNE